MSSYTPAQLDAMARQAGFRSYAEWQAYQQQQQRRQQVALVHIVPERED